VKLKRAGLQIHPAGFVTKSLITFNFCKGAEEAGFAIAKKLDEAIAGLEVPSPLKVGFSSCALTYDVTIPFIISLEVLFFTNKISEFY
jgi:precorrin-3B C17-methyltransferase